MYVRVSVYVSVPLRTCVSTHVHPQFQVSVFIYVCTCMYMGVHMCMCIYVPRYVFIYICEQIAK